MSDNDITLKEVKEAVETGNRAYEELKGKMDERIDELKNGFDDVVRQDEIKKINDAIDAAQATNDKFDARQRICRGARGKSVSVVGISTAPQGCQARKPRPVQ